MSATFTTKTGSDTETTRPRNTHTSVSPQGDGRIAGSPNRISFAPAAVADDGAGLMIDARPLLRSISHDRIGID